MAVEDKRLTDVKTEESVALTENEKLYAGLGDSVDKQYQALHDKTLAYADKQAEIQQKQSDLAIQKLETEKANAEKDYTKEQSGAYVDWQKQADPYGVKAEQTAAMGMGKGTGYSESLQVSMYNTYQNRITVAREAFVRAQTEYDTAMAEAKLQNSSILAEIAFNANKEALEYLLQGTLYKNQLLTEKADKALQIKSFYSSKYNSVLDQINAEKSLALQEREMKIKEEEWDIKKAQYDAAKIEQNNSTRQGNTSYSRNSYVKKQTNDEAKIQKQDQKAAETRKKTAVKTASSGSIKTYQAAQSFLKKYGIKMDTPLLTSIQWQRGKRAGELSSEFEGVGSYRDYLKMYCTIAANHYM